MLSDFKSKHIASLSDSAERIRGRTVNAADQQLLNECVDERMTIMIIFLHICKHAAKPFNKKRHASSTPPLNTSIIDDNIGLTATQEGKSCHNNMNIGTVS